VTRGQDASYWSDPARHAWDGLWMNAPGVRERINFRVTGEAGLWPIDWLKRVVPDRVPFPTALSIGSGLGNLERALVDLDVVRTVTGIDVNAGIVSEAARRASGGKGYDRIRYVTADAGEFLKSAAPCDAIFFHESLHHFDDPAGILDLVAGALGPRGVLYLDEYVGPSRQEWTWRDLVEWNLVYRGLPGALRRTHVIRRPISDLDPTEAVASSEILPALERRFRIVARRDYGGNLVAPIFPSLLRPDQPGGPSPERFAEVIGELLDREDRLLARGRKSFQSVVVAEPLGTSGL
jgi:O-antigen biosynthesis protein